MKYLPCIHIMVGKQGKLPPTPPFSSFLTGSTHVKPDASSFAFRDKLFMNAIILVNDDDANSISNTFQRMVFSPYLTLWVYLLKILNI